jgi:hypothetical protein
MGRVWAGRERGPSCKEPSTEPSGLAARAPGPPRLAKPSSRTRELRRKGFRRLRWMMRVLLGVLPNVIRLVGAGSCCTDVSSGTVHRGKEAIAWLGVDQNRPMVVLQLGQITIRRHGPPLSQVFGAIFHIHIPHQRHAEGLLWPADAGDASSRSRRRGRKASRKVGGMQMPSRPDVKRASQAKPARHADRAPSDTRDAKVRFE